MVEFHDACRLVASRPDDYVRSALERLGHAPRNLVGREISGPGVSWLLHRPDARHLAAACAICEASVAFEAGHPIGDEALAALRSLFAGELHLTSTSARLDLATGEMRSLDASERISFSSGSVLLSGDDALLGSSVIDPFAKLTRDRDLPEVHARLQHAAAWLSCASPRFERAVAGLLRSIVPMERAARGVPSTSTNEVVGAICITDHDDPAILAEQIVHESAHGFLFLLQDHDPLLDPETHGDGWSSGLLYSPWRDDPRPIAGLLHGAVVFSRVACMHAAMIGQSATSRSRLAAIVPQLEIAYELLSLHGRWTPLGYRLTEGLSALLARLRPIEVEVGPDTHPLYVEASSILAESGAARARQRRHRTRFSEHFA